MRVASTIIVSLALTRMVAAAQNLELFVQERFGWAYPIDGQAGIFAHRSNCPML